MSTSPEYECFLDCVPLLRLSVKDNLLALNGELLAARLISPTKESSLRNRNVDEEHRAADLVSLVLNKIKEESANYHVFVNILKKDPTQYNTVIEVLEEKYRARNGGSSLPLQDLSNGQSAPVIVKSKPVVDAESAHPYKSVADVVSQTPSEWSNTEHQPHLPFGASCGCTVCKNDLGCPKPITAKTAFPLLEHMEGLDKIQKEDLHTRLSMETQEISLQFYSLLSNFFKSLKERNIPIDDLKTHLMVLDAFDNDDQHQSVFLEQMEKLEKASTINEVFKVIKVFCSFFNYGLIKHLINIVGSDEDKGRYEEYESKFTQYAKRRIYECPPKTAMCTDQQCDMYVKLESRFSQKLSVSDLRVLHYDLCKLLKVSQHVLRLCCVEKGCIRLTFQIPHFVKQQLFPLTPEKEQALLQLNVTKLTCGDYEFPNEENQENPLGNDSHTHSRVIARSCLDCSSSSGEIPLLCGGHFICSDCLVKRTTSIVVSEDLLVCNACSQVTSTSESMKAHTYRDAVLLKRHTDTKLKTGEQQPQQKPQTQPQPARAVWIFVNDSNIWIEAKKLQSKQKLFKTSEDHRVRMDMGKLADVLAKGRPIRQGKLYGSEPPRIDTVWEKIREQGWEVHTSQRTSRHGKERLLTSTFVVDVVSLAEKTLPEERSTIILVSGDSSIIPAIEKVIEVDGWNVEIYMWSHATSRQLQTVQQKYRNRITISSLDPYYSDVTFTNMRFDCSNKNFLEMAKKSSVVFTVDPDSVSFPNHIPTDQWMSKLEELAQWPCQYYWYNNSETGQRNKLVIVFKQDSKAGFFDVQNFLEKVTSDTKYQILSVIRVQSFRDFTLTEQLDRSNGHFEQIGLFDQQDVHRGFYADSVYVTNSNAHITKWNTHLITT